MKKLFFFRFLSLNIYFTWVVGMTLFPFGPAAIYAADMLVFSNAVIVPELLLAEISCEDDLSICFTVTFSYASSNLIVPCKIVFAFFAYPTVMLFNPLFNY